MASPEAPVPQGGGEWWTQEDVSPNHFYAAYSFDDAQTRQADVIGVIEEAKRHGYPVRYWWLSDAMELRGDPDRLIVCVHHPSRDANAGLDLYEALKQQGTQWDDLESAAVEEYLTYSRAIQNENGISLPDGRPLFPRPTEEKPNDPPELFSREDEPLFVLTAGDIQTEVQDTLGRFLTDSELKALLKEAETTIDWRGALAVALFVCQMNGTIGPAQGRLDDVGEPPPPDLEGNLTAEPGPLNEGAFTQFLIYYLLSGMMMVEAPDAQAANKSAFGQLHAVVGKADTEGVTQTEATHLRLGNLEVAIESVEAMPFPTEEI